MNLAIGTECQVYAPGQPGHGLKVRVSKDYGLCNVRGVGLRFGYTVEVEGRSYFAAPGQLVARADAPRQSYSHLRLVVSN